MKLKLEALERLLLLIRFALLLLALVVLFVFDLPVIAVVIATVALLMRFAMFTKTVREWLIRRFVITDDAATGDTDPDRSRD